MTPAEYGRHLAAQTPPLPDANVEAAARLYAAWLATHEPPARVDAAA